MSENKSKFPSRPKILAVSLAGILIALPAYAADNPPAEVTESSNIEALTVTGKRSADQKGADDVYYKNVSNAMSARNTSNATGLTPPATCAKA